jgi:general secretion pathway protein F/type IV pilus assembly protein PilC
VLNELSSYLILQERIKKQLSQALVYPSFIIVVSLLMISFMLTVVPKITAIFETTGQALPSLTQFIITLAHFFATYWLIMALALLIAVGAFSFKMATSTSFKKTIHAFILELPIVGKWLRREIWRASVPLRHC